MTDIRRYDPGNRPVFMTAVCHNRQPYLKTDADKELLLAVMREVKTEKPFFMMGYVILDDHFHWMIRLGGGASLSGSPKQQGTLTYNGDVGKYAISQIMQSVKLRFTRRYKKHHGIDANGSLWQRRFWDHIARDPEDLNRHLDYIHYNPVKHGYAANASDYPFSSFPEYAGRGVYKSGWGETGINDVGQVTTEWSQGAPNSGAP